MTAVITPLEGAVNEGGQALEGVIDHAEKIGEHTATLATHNAAIDELKQGVKNLQDLADSLDDRISSVARDSWNTVSSESIANIQAQISELGTKIEKLEPKEPDKPAEGSVNPPKPKEQAPKQQSRGALGWLKNIL